VIDFLNRKIVEVTALVRGASVLGAILMVAFAYYRARTLVAVLVAALTAGVFLWSISNTSWWQQRVQEETDTLGTHSEKVQVVELTEPLAAPVVI
jgi:hypothetical protein